jgi:hypothetical protein
LTCSEQQPKPAALTGLIFKVLRWCDPATIHGMMIAHRS